MADIASVALTKELLSAVAFAATAVGGDLITLATSASDLVLLFKNDHASAVTVTILNVTPSAVEVSGYGRVEKADATFAVPPGDVYAYSIPAAQIAQYLTAAKIALTYTGHNALFKVAALRTA